MKTQRLNKLFEEVRPALPVNEEEIGLITYLILSGEKDFMREIDKINKESNVYKHFEFLIKEFQS